MDNGMDPLHLKMRLGVVYATGGSPLTPLYSKISRRPGLFHSGRSSGSVGHQ